MNTIEGKGQLRHRFHGTYSAIIALVFASPSHARDAARVLGSDWTPGKIADGSLSGLVWVGESEALDACKALLGRFGADTRKIDSIARSIDFGEPFTVSIPVTPEEQVILF